MIGKERSAEALLFLELSAPTIQEEDFRARRLYKTY
jgi:hypothetical protein